MEIEITGVTKKQLARTDYLLASVGVQEDGETIGAFDISYEKSTSGHYRHSGRRFVNRRGDFSDSYPSNELLEEVAQRVAQESGETVRQLYR